MRGKIFIYNSLVEHSEIFEMSISVDEFKNEQESFDEYLNNNFNCDDDGFYEYDGFIGNNVYQVQIDDEDDDWESRFDNHVIKIKEYFSSKDIALTKLNDFKFEF